jgi:DNA integrity scanning protein DisA with diadenylate cyclase activity
MALRAPKHASENEVIKTCMDIALHNTDHGCIFVIDLNGKKRSNYYVKVFKILKGHDGKTLSIMNEADKHIIKHLATMDGATIIDSKGNLREFGVTLKGQITFFGHGKRHAFSLGTSKLNDVVCILASEEDKHVRLFRDGVCVADMDSKTYIPTALRYKMVYAVSKPLTKILKECGIAKSKSQIDPTPALITLRGGTLIPLEGFEKIKTLFE